MIATSRPTAAAARIAFFGCAMTNLYDREDHRRGSDAPARSPVARSIAYFAAVVELFRIGSGSKDAPNTFLRVDLEVRGSGSPGRLSGIERVARFPLEVELRE